MPSNETLSNCKSELGACGCCGESDIKVYWWNGDWNCAGCAKELDGDGDEDGEE